MANLTSKELTALEDNLGMEQLLVAKYRSIAGTTTDPALKTKCEQIAHKHQEHYKRLLNLLS